MNDPYSEAVSPKNKYSKLSKKERELIKKARKLLQPLAEKYNVPAEEFLKQEMGETAPVSIFTVELTPLEAVAKFLKENKNYSLREISKLISRDERNVWHIYSDSRKKHPKLFKDIKADILVPIKIFSNQKLSALESIVVYLKEKFSLNYSQVAVLLNRDKRTVWTVYQRAKKKNAE